MHFEIVFVTLFSVATLVALIARAIRVPYTVALVVAGLILGATHALESPHLTQELLYAVFLPGLLFEAAFHLDFKKFWANKIAISSLAVPGLVVAIGLTALILTPIADALDPARGFTMEYALVFAALIAATDPIAVVGLFKTLGAPKRLAVLVEGESLLNDGAAVVLFTLALGVAMGEPLSFVTGILAFIEVVGIGGLIGAAVGMAAAQVIRRVDEPTIEITLTMVAAYGSFAFAEHFHVSGVIATVVSGMICGNYAAQVGMSPSTRIAVESFWEYLAFALNSIIFLLIGLEVDLAALGTYRIAILIAWIAVMAGRAAVTAAVTLLLKRTHERIPWSYAAVLTHGGLRGGLSMVLVLALAPDFPHRELLVHMTFGVVLLSILVQGLSMEPLLKRLGLIGRQSDRQAYEMEKGKTRALQAALDELNKMAANKTIHPDVARELMSSYQRRLEEAEEHIRRLHIEKAELRREERMSATRHMLRVEKDALVRAIHQGHIGADAGMKLLTEIDARLLALDREDERMDEKKGGEDNDNKESLDTAGPAP